VAAMLLRLSEPGGHRPPCFRDALRIQPVDATH